jgi:hypothetical protein
MILGTILMFYVFLAVIKAALSSGTSDHERRSNKKFWDDGAWYWDHNHKMP